MKNLLKEKGYKATPARISILEIFGKSEVPMTAEEVEKNLRKLKIKTDTATVYRTLTAFNESGILKRVDLRKDALYFELATEHHHHIVCTNCNLVEDFENQEIERALNKIAQRSSKFINIKEHSLELFGLCKACA